MDIEGTTTHAPELETATQGQGADTFANEQPDLETLSDDGVESEEGSGDNAETEGEGDEAKAEAEGDLIDFTAEDGSTYKVPKGLEGHLLRNADYTRKTQEVAELRRSVEATQADTQRNFEVSQEVLGARAALMNVDQALANYQNVDWTRLQTEDPFTAQSAWMEFQQLKEQRGHVASFLDQKQAEIASQGEQATATRLMETAQYAQKNIPGWSPEVDAKVTNFAVSELGFTQDTLKQAYNPQVYRALHLAWIGHQTLSKQKNAPSAQNQKAPASAPLQKVTARANPPASGLDDRLTAEEWMKRRNAQVRRG